MWIRAAVAFSCAGVLTFTGLPGLQGTAHAAKGKRCDDTFKLTGNPGSDFPWEQSIHVRDKRNWDSYTYDAPRQSLDGLTLKGTKDEQRKFLESLDKPYTDYPKGSPDRVYAQYRDYLTRNSWQDTRYGGFEKWLSDAWILPNNNNRRGYFFEKKVVKDMRLLGPDWLCQEDVPVLDKDGKPVMKDGKPVVRKFDAVNYKTNQFLEFKAGPTRDTNQDFANEKFLEDPRRKNARITYVNGESKDGATGRYLERLSEKGGMDDKGRPRVTAYEHRSTSKPDYTRGKYSKPDTNFSPGGNNRAAGGASRIIDGSAPSPKEMKERMDRIRAADPNGMRGRGPAASTSPPSNSPTSASRSRARVCRTRSPHRRSTRTRGSATAARPRRSSSPTPSSPGSRSPRTSSGSTSTRTSPTASWTGSSARPTPDVSCSWPTWR